MLFHPTQDTTLECFAFLKNVVLNLIAKKILFQSENENKRLLWQRNEVKVNSQRMSNNFFLGKIQATSFYLVNNFFKYIFHITYISFIFS